MNLYVYANSIQTELVTCPTEQQLSVMDSFSILNVGTISTTLGALFLLMINFIII